MPKKKLRDLFGSRKAEAYYRGKLAALVNKTAGMKWIPEINHGNLGGYISGKPDATVLLTGPTLAFVEMKAAWGAAKLGSWNTGKTEGWHASQRNWWQNVAKPFCVPYFIVLAIAPKDSVYALDASWFAIRPEEWLSFQDAVGKKSARYDEFASAFQAMTVGGVVEILGAQKKETKK